MQLKKIVAVFGITAVMSSSFGLSVSADNGFDLNNIGGGAPATVTEQGTNSNSNGNAFGIPDSDTYAGTSDSIRGNIDAGVTITEEDMQKAGEIVSPIVRGIRWAISVILMLFPALLILNTMIDLLCILISPFRRAVEAVNGGGAGGGGMHGMPGMPGGQQGGGDDGSVFSTVAKWASAEAAAAIMAAKPTGGGAGGMGMPGAYGMPGGGGGAPAKTKSVLMQYLKKRTVALVIAGVCIVCFACTAFTDLGLKLGDLIVRAVGGISA